MITEAIDKYASLKNQPDTCIVWVALGDWELQENPNSGEKTAVEVQTDDKEQESILIRTIRIS